MFEIFRKLGGEKLSLDVFAARDRRPSADLVSKWRRERRIPPIRAVVLLAECERRGIKASYHDDCVLLDPNAEAAE